MTTTPFRSTGAPGRASDGTHRDDLLDHLSARELEVLALMAEGRSNRAIGEQLTVELKTVETHVSRVFTKLGLNEDRHENRRVLAVLTYFGRESPEGCDARCRPGPARASLADTTSMRSMPYRGSC
jgi:DNA-binding NarL/FixJ family response regulator